MPRAFSGRSRWWVAIVQVVLLLVTFALPVGAATGPAPLTGSQLIDLLRTYGVVKGDDTGNLNLDKPITRAEMITIVVRAIGGEQEAQSYKGFGLFSDAKGHWAEGYLTFASTRGLVKGDGNGTVRPGDPINYAEALTLTLRLLGKEPTTGNWPDNVILAAAELQLLPEGLTAGDLRQPAVRGLVFQSLAKGITTIPMADGKTFLQAHLDQAAPVISLDAVPANTKDSKVTVTGTVQDAVEVTVNGTPVTLSGTRFSRTVDLQYGNNEITITARDLANNVSVKKASIARALPVSQLEVSGPAAVRAGETASFAVKALDQAGKTLPAEGLTAKVEGGIGSFDANTLTFTAGNTTASGKITFSIGTVSKSVDVQVKGPSSRASSLYIRPVNGDRAVAVSKPMTVEVAVVDSTGTVVQDDNGRQVTISVGGLPGLTVSPTTASTRDGVATFTVRGSTVGTLSVSATSSGLNPSLRNAAFGTTYRVVLSSDNTSLIQGGAASTVVRAELRDENGLPVTNDTGSDIVIELQQQGATGTLIDPILTIRRGYNNSTSSGDNGTFTAGAQTGTTLLTGRMASSHGYTVDPISIGITRPQVGAGTKLQVLNLNNTLVPGVDTASFYIRVVDGAGNVVRDGSYAFQVQVDTSNNDAKTRGIPAGVSIHLGNTTKIPVYTGTTPTGDYVYGRTRDGSALITVTYTKSGTVTVTPILVGSVNEAYDDAGVMAAATGSAGFTSAADRAVFATAANRLKLTVDSDLGNDQSAGATFPNAGRYFTLRAWVQDANSAWVPNATNAITLEPDAANSRTTGPQAPENAKNAVNGKAEFRVYATTATGCDRYRVTSAGLTTSAYVDLCIQNTLPAQPSIIVIRGATSSSSNAPYVVGAADEFMEIELDRVPTEKNVAVVVYRTDSSSPIYTSDVIDISSVAPRIRVPKSLLPSGQRTYQVALRNGSGEGTKSATSQAVTVGAFASGITISSAYYDASTTGATSGKLMISGGGYSTNGQIRTDKLWIKDASNPASIMNLTGATARVTSWGQIEIDLNTVPTKKAALENPAQFSGSDVTIEGDAGWFVLMPNGETADASSAKPVYTLGNISRVVFDVVNNRLLLTGVGFSLANLNLAALTITEGANSLVLDSTNAYQSPSRIGDTDLIVTLTPDGAARLKDKTKFSGNDLLTASIGWLYSGSYKAPAVPGVRLEAMVGLTSVVYTKSVRAADNSITTPATITIVGSGFFSGGPVAQKGTVDLSKLSVIDLRSATPAQPLTASAASVTSDGEIVITLDNASALICEDTFGGDSVYLVGQAGWFKDFQGRSAGAISDRYFRLTTD